VAREPYDIGKQQLRFLVNEEHTGQRLDYFLAERVSWLSRMRIGRAIAEGDCLLNGSPARVGTKLSLGDTIWISLAESPITAMTAEEIPLRVIYEDNDLVVIDKAAGMLVHPTRGVKGGTLANALAYHFNNRQDLLQPVDDILPEIEPPAGIVRPGMVHRLDRATSGLMVVAKNQRALSILSRHFHKKLVEKRYIAVLDGMLNESEITITAPIGRDEAGPPFWRVMEAGRYAETRLRLISNGTGAAMVELEPVTGRTNQLRIHCAHIGHPIKGDDWYGGRPANRLCLHAAALAFNHPSGGAWMDFRSPLPAEIDEMFRMGAI
jgi:23S rRNA pseudouridine1911/1915/1917 synthase